MDCRSSVGELRRSAELKLARLGISERKGRCSINDQHHLVASPDRIEYFVERIESGLFTHGEYENALKRAGLRVRYDKKGLMGRGLFFWREGFVKAPIFSTISTPQGMMLPFYLL